MHNLLVQFFTLDSSKIAVFKTYFFFDIATNHNDQPNYVKHILDIIYVFFTLFGDSVCGGGGGGNGVVHVLLMQFFAPHSSKIEVSETFFLTSLPLTMTNQAM